MDSIKLPGAEPSARCRFCLQPSGSARLTRRNLVAFYTMFRPCGLGHNFSEAEMSTWVCLCCWTCTNQCIKFVQRARSAERALLGANVQISGTKLETGAMQTVSVHTHATNTLNFIDYKFAENSIDFKVVKSDNPSVDLLTEDTLNYRDDISTESTMDVQLDNFDSSKSYYDEVKVEPNSSEDSDAFRPDEAEKKSPEVKYGKSVREEMREMEKEKLRDLRMEKLKFSLRDMLEEVEMKKTSETYLNKKFKCEACGAAYNEEETFDNHFMRCHHESAGEHQCEVCMYRFPALALLNRHVALHARRWRCLDCGYVMTARSQCATHHARCGAGPQSHACHQCGKTFPTAVRLTVHTRRVHRSQREKRFTCDTCGKSFVYKHQMRIHIRTHLNIKPFECETCGKKFTTQALHRIHQKTHVPRVASEDRYCVECDRYFRSPHQLMLHLTSSLSHVTKDTFRHACAECPDRFKAMSQLQLHVNTVHLHNRTHPCQLCDKAYYTKGALTAHMKNKHIQSERRRDHVCSFCGKAFLTSVSLKNHVVGVHQKQRPYACDICGATFGYKAALYTHNKLKHKMKNQRADTASNRARFANKP